MAAIVILLVVVCALQAMAIGALARAVLFGDLGAERRGRRAACSFFVEIAAAHPPAAAMARAALRVVSLPGDPGYADLLRGAG